MHDGVRKLLGAAAVVGGVGLLVFGSRYDAGSAYSIADTVGPSERTRLVGFVVSAVLFLGFGSHWVRRSKTTRPTRRRRPAFGTRER